MRFLIVAALFLILSAACASPVYIAARGPQKPAQDPFPELTNAELVAMSIRQIIADAAFDRLAHITYKDVEYQILVLVAGKVENRHLGEDLDRFLNRKILWGFRPVSDSDSHLKLFFFKGHPFSLKPPNQAFIGSPVWEDAGKSYYKGGWDDDNAWKEMRPADKTGNADPNNFICKYNAEGKPEFAVYMPNLRVRRLGLENKKPLVYTPETPKAVDLSTGHWNRILALDVPNHRI